MILKINDIKKLIPHRKPFLFIQECKIIERGKIGESYRIFKEDEYFFEGHFPQMPIVPGVILIETLAQTAGVVVAKGFENNDEKSVLFMNISKAKFRKPVFPNELISFEVQFINNVRSVYKFQGTAIKNKVKVCEAEFSAMIIDKSSKEII